MMKAIGLCTMLVIAPWYALPAAATDIFVGKGMFIEDVSRAVNVAANATVVVPDMPSANYRAGLKTLVRDLVDLNVQWVAVKACQGPHPMPQFTAALAEEFADPTNAGGNANLLPKLAGYHVLVASSDEVPGEANAQINAEAAAARSLIKIKPPALNCPAGWVIMPSDNYYASAKNGPTQTAKEASVALYLNGIASAVSTQNVKLAYCAPVATDDTANPGQLHPHEAHPNAPSIKTRTFAKDRFFIRRKFESHVFTGTTDRMVKVAIPRVFWGKGNVPDFGAAGPLHGPLLRWLNAGNDWARVIPLGQVAPTSRIAAFRAFIAPGTGIPDPDNKIQRAAALWTFETAPRQQRLDFMAP
ncbi:MAG: hypothetical protein ACR2IE_13060 [Candidatus Sumerlaeaceae bacterium]